MTRDAVVAAVAVVAAAWGAVSWWRWRRLLVRKLDRLLALLEEILAALRGQ